MIKLTSYWLAEHMKRNLTHCIVLIQNFIQTKRNMRNERFEKLSIRRKHLKPPYLFSWWCVTSGWLTNSGIGGIGN